MEKRVVFAKAAMVVLAVAAVICPACAGSGEGFEEDSGVIRVSLQGLSAKAATTEHEVSPGDYTIVVESHAEDGMAEYNVEVLGAAGGVVSRSQISVDGALIPVKDGATGFGAADATVTAGESTDITIPVLWDGVAPGGALNIGIENQVADDIEYFTVTRAPEVEPAEPLVVVARVTNQGAVASDSIVEVTMGAEYAVLLFDPTREVYEGTLIAPSVPGDYALTVEVESRSGAVTVATKPMTVVASLEPVALDCGFEGRIYRNLRSHSVALNIQVTVCDSGIASLEIKDPDGDEELIDLENGQTETLSLDIPAKSTLDLDCGSGEGTCSYQIEF